MCPRCESIHIYVTEDKHGVIYNECSLCGFSWEEYEEDSYSEKIKAKRKRGFEV